MSSFSSWKQRAKELKTLTYALYFALRDPRTPWYAKLAGGCIVAYVVSPIDLIPDFIPIIGYLDDLLLVPLGIAFTIKLIPAAVWQECRQKAMNGRIQDRRIACLGTAFIVSIWVLVAWLIYRAVFSTNPRFYYFYTEFWAHFHS
jgi:uncharacterized membrane protein YkvA (DUF1232 family)